MSAENQKLRDGGDFSPSLCSAVVRALAMIDQKTKLIAEIQDAIRKNLLERRKRAGITQKQLAKMLGFRSVAYVSELEGGTRRWTEDAAKMADIYLPNTMMSGHHQPKGDNKQ